jgi:NAD(P)H-dependent FMN reductase
MFGELAFRTGGNMAVAALEGAASAGAGTELLDLRELDLPMYNPDDDMPNAAASRLIEACHGVDGMLWSSPMYQGSAGACRRSSTTRWSG